VAQNYVAKKIPLSKIILQATTAQIVTAEILQILGISTKVISIILLFL